MKRNLTPVYKCVAYKPGYGKVNFFSETRIGAEKLAAKYEAHDKPIYIGCFKSENARRLITQQG